MSSIIGKIAIWIGIVAQIYFSVVFVRMISINIAGGSDYETIFLLGLILALSLFYQPSLLRFIWKVTL